NKWRERRKRTMRKKLINVVITVTLLSFVGAAVYGFVRYRQNSATMNLDPGVKASLVDEATKWFHQNHPNHEGMSKMWAYGLGTNDPGVEGLDPFFWFAYSDAEGNLNFAINS